MGIGCTVYSDFGGVDQGKITRTLCRGHNVSSDLKELVKTGVSIQICSGASGILGEKWEVKDRRC